MRRFTIADAMILVGAAATAFFGIRSGVSFSGSGRLIDSIIDVASYLLLSFGTAAVILRAVPPRPPLRRVRRQPGLIACVAVLITGSAWSIGLTISLEYAEPFYHPVPALLPILIDRLPEVDRNALAVVVAWSTLALSGRWHAERFWIDRLGRAIGLLWIAALIAQDIAPAF